MNVILWGAVASLIGLAALALMGRPRAAGTAALSGVAATAFMAIALSIETSIALVALVLIAILAAVLFRRNTVAVQRGVTFGSVAILAVGLLTGLGMTAFTQPQATVVTVAEGGNPASYPVTSTASSVAVEDAISLASGDSDIPAVKYYAYEAEAGTNNFGPAIHLNTAQDGVHRMGLKMVEDPLYAAAIIEFRHHGGAMSQEAAHQRAHGYVNDRQVQLNDSQALLASIESAYLADFGATRYESLGMIPGNNPKEMPTLTKFSTQPAMEQVLVVKFKDGKGMYLRVACDLQPSLKKGFESVPTPPTPERPPSVPPTTHVPFAPPTGGAPPPSTSQVPPTSGTPTPSTSTSTTKTTTTTKTTETTKTTPSTTVPTTSTTTPCPPEHPDCKDPDGGPPTTDGQTPNPAPSGEPETTVPVEPNPMDPGTPSGAPAPGVGAPGATNVPTTARPTENLPTPVEPAPEPTDPGGGSSDPDAHSASPMGAASAPAAVASASAPIAQQPAPAQAAPIAEPQAPAPAASAPAEAAESVPPVVEVTEIESMSFSQQSAPIQGGVLLLILFIGGLLMGSLVRKH